MTVTECALKRIMYEGKSAFQHVQVVELDPHGKTLVLDGKTQSAAADEHFYHETLVHAPMLLHPNPKRVFIGGGGEFATAREVLRHTSVEECVMVDIDEVVCDVCRKELPEWSAGAYEDPRLKCYYEDAYAFLEKCEGSFDVIIMDIADPIEAGPGIKLYTQEFYTYAVTRLSKDGVLVTQSGPNDIHNYDECGTVIHNTLKTAFKHVFSYKTSIPSFGSAWGFNVAHNNDDAHNVKDVTPEVTDALIAKRITGDLYFYDGESHRGNFNLAKHIRAALQAETRVMTIADPVFMF